ncbi:response regulator transcription factor [Solihabitans fulvus]|uniref:Response regulator transcription factor n=1 Tax=Solihabitans fulvus TaxID=1892852 RepID=A0A5B2XGU2_9PSEU|nr:response regulator transcription factor [Solihabitans fulvus]KAA2262613.1 response regulator transcription factor [Solihabitans fulvus]
MRSTIVTAPRCSAASRHPRPVPDQVRVALLDSAAIYHRGVELLVDTTDGLEWAGATTSPSDMLSLCEFAPPHVLLVDSALDPEFQLTRLVSARRWWTAVVVLARTPADRAQAARARQDGALGWIDRDCATGELLAAIRTTLAGEIAEISPARAC